MKAGRNLAVICLTILLSVVSLGSGAIAGNGNGAMDGTGPVVSIYDGIPVTVSGVVASVGIQGQGIAIDTGSEIVTVYGMGPVKFWDASSVARPEVGEAITVTGYEVTFSDGSTKLIATSVTVDGQSIELRDSVDGTPLWRGSMGNGAQNKNNS